jgi:hypothetical protein
VVRTYLALVLGQPSQRPWEISPFEVPRGIHSKKKILAQYNRIPLGKWNHIIRMAQITRLGRNFGIFFFQQRYNQNGNASSNRTSKLQVGVDPKDIPCDHQGLAAHPFSSVYINSYLEF